MFANAELVFEWIDVNTYPRVCEEIEVQTAPIVFSVIVKGR